MEGWDFTWLRASGRYRIAPLPWSYDDLVRERIAASPDVLDLGTGGGERLASLAPLPPRTVATESYPPNVPMAARRLAPLGGQVVRTAGARDNVLHGRADPRGELPFRDESFHLVIDRNEAYSAHQVSRVLCAGGTFLTEQSGAGEISAIGEALELSPPPDDGPAWDLDLARAQLRAAGLPVVRSGEANHEMEFADVGALAWYLRAVPWVAPGFSVERHRTQLGRLERKLRAGAPLRIPLRAFWLEALRPPVAEHRALSPPPR